MDSLKLSKQDFGRKLNSPNTLFFKISIFLVQKKILEVGCGVGAQTEILLRRFPKTHVTGIDLNDKQLEAAKKIPLLSSHGPRSF